MNRKTIVIIGTGGTIAGVAESSDPDAGYTSGALTANDLVEALPGSGSNEIKSRVNLRTEEFCNIDSCSMTPDLWLALAKRVNALISDDTVDGIVITHGTDTMEETAFFLYLTVNTHKSVIMTGAMLPATAANADGPGNLLCAIRLACEGAPGVSVVMNGTKYDPSRLVKNNPHATDAFTEVGDSDAAALPEQIVQKPHAPGFDTICRYDISGISALKSVEIIDLYPGADPDILKYVLEEIRPGGIVLSCPGDGTLTPEVVDIIRQSSYRGTILRASRTGRGPVSERLFDDANIGKRPPNLLPTGDMTPQKARVLLMLSISADMMYNDDVVGVKNKIRL